MIGINHLPHQSKDEKIVLLLRRHPFIISRQILFYVFMAFIPIIIRVFINIYYPDLLNDVAAKSALIILMLTYYLFVWLLFYHAWIDNYLDVWIVTTHRILSIELQGLFNRTVSEHKLSRIQDVTTEQIGFFPHLLDYGEVHIQTAGMQKRFVFEQVPHPEKISRQIAQMIAWHRRAYPDDH